MNGKITYFRKAMGREQFSILALLTGAGAAPPALTYGPGIKSVTRTGVGAYTLTLADNWAGGLVGFKTDYADTNYGTVATRKRAILTSIDVLNTKVITLQVEDATSGTNAASDLTATQQLAIELVLRNTKDV